MAEIKNLSPCLQGITSSHNDDHVGHGSDTSPSVYTDFDDAGGNRHSAPFSSIIDPGLDSATSTGEITPMNLSPIEPGDSNPPPTPSCLANCHSIIWTRPDKPMTEDTHCVVDLNSHKHPALLHELQKKDILMYQIEEGLYQILLPKEDCENETRFEKEVRSPLATIKTRKSSLVFLKSPALSDDLRVQLVKAWERRNLLGKRKMYWDGQ